MPRRTVTVASGFDRAIRTLQAKLLKMFNRDVTYTEALNMVLYFGLMPIHGRDSPSYWTEDNRKLSDQDIEELLSGYDLEKLKFEGLLDNL